MNPFDREEAKRFLLKKQEDERQKREEERIHLLDKVVSFLKKEFKDNSVKVYLVGSIIRPFQFEYDSDVDIVLENFSGDRFELWAKIERSIGRNVEIIPFEMCHFQEFVLKEGLRVV
jgi:predicted nucleotidyltransferase